MSLNSDLNESFLKFSKKEAELLINKSRIHDKQTHIEALKRYKKIFISNNKNKNSQSTSGNSGNSGSNSSNKGMSNEGSSSNDKRSNESPNSHSNS